MKGNVKAFISWVNETFKPEYPQHPVAFIRTDGAALISGETTAYLPETKGDALLEKSGFQVVDYYGEYRGGDPWIHPAIETEAKRRGLFLEWENAGCVSVSKL